MFFSPKKSVRRRGPSHGPHPTRQPRREFIGGVAVLVTLIYLALQVRQSAQAQQTANELAKADALHRSTEGFQAFRLMVLKEGINAILRKARRDMELTPEASAAS